MPARPSARVWSLLESDALAEAQVAARLEIRARAQLSHMLAGATSSGTCPMDELDPGYRTCQDSGLPTGGGASWQAALVDRMRPSATSRAALLPPPPAHAVARRSDNALEGASAEGKLRLVATRTVERHSGVRRRQPQTEMLEMEVTLVADAPSQRIEHREPLERIVRMVDLGFELGDANVISSIARDGAADTAGLMVGDRIAQLNGQELAAREKLERVLLDEVVLPGDRVRLGIIRALDTHMEAVMRRATGTEARERRAPNSPRMLPADRSCAKERRLAFEAAGRPLPRRDTYTGRVMSDTFCANGGRTGRML